MDTLSFLKSEFAKYYTDADLRLPERFGRREWGFFYFSGSGMQRHLSFNRLEELREFLVARTPKHAYHSSAYYQTPDMQPMPKKAEGWLGADLIFDLDDEHLSGMENKSTAERLEVVKRIVKDKLLNDFLLTDFGFSEDNIRVTFSGGRGYHIHIFDPKVLTLESPERREIVDYITGLNPNFDKIFIKEVYSSKSVGRFRQDKTRMKPLSDESAPGWRGRITKGLMILLSEMEEMTKAECIEKFKSVPFRGEGISDNKARTIYDLLYKGEIGKRNVDAIRNEKVIDILSPDINRDIVVNLAIEQVAVRMAGETDEPVTVDTKRLIRLPGSLHGKTGLKVVTITIDELDDFMPLRDAIVFDDSDVEVTLTDNAEFDLNENHYKLAEGKNTLPKYAAIYLMLRGIAKIT